MTLIEVLMVMVLIALAAGGTTFSINALARTSLRSSCMRIISAAKFAYSRAIVQGKTVRVVFDFSSHTIAVEEAHGRVTLARSDDSRRDRGLEDGGAGVDPWAAARARLEKTMEPSFGRSPFGPLRGREGEVLERYKARPIGDGIRIVRIYAPHEVEPREEGKGAIYFFPGGKTQHAVVHLADSRGTIYSVELHPLTGKGTVHNRAIKPLILDEHEFSDMEDRG